MIPEWSLHDVGRQDLHIYRLRTLSAKFQASRLTGSIRSLKWCRDGGKKVEKKRKKKRKVHWVISRVASQLKNTQNNLVWYRVSPGHIHIAMYRRKKFKMSLKIPSNSILHSLSLTYKIWMCQQLILLYKQLE